MKDAQCTLQCREEQVSGVPCRFDFCSEGHPMGSSSSSAVFQHFSALAAPKSAGQKNFLRLKLLFFGGGLIKAPFVEYVFEGF